MSKTLETIENIIKARRADPAFATSNRHRYWVFGEIAHSEIPKDMYDPNGKLFGFEILNERHEDPDAVRFMELPQ